MLKKMMIVMGFAGAMVIAGSAKAPYVSAGADAHADATPLADAHGCYMNCNQQCSKCSQQCNDNACRSACHIQADVCARSFGYTGHARGGNTCNGACEGAK